MCGITGIFDRKDYPVRVSQLKAMTDLLTHRGPDEEGYFVNARGLENRKIGKLGNAYNTKEGGDVRTLPVNFRSENGSKGNVGLGHRRVSIIDLSTGQQPLSNEDGSVWVVFNGEIYNFQDIKQELEGKGHRFRTHSDTEAIVHAWEEWGEDAVTRFRGMFAIALWDERQQVLWLVRDRLGKKPLYYASVNSRFLFASELKSLLVDPGIEREMDLTSISDYLSLLYIPAPKTIFKNIHKLPAAHYALVTPDKIEVHEYWDLSFAPSHTLSGKQMEEELLGILDEATRMRMISDVPLGAFLSGGVDSSAIVGLMSAASRSSVLTNSISFSVAKYNEAHHAKKVAGLFHTDHHEFQVTPEAIPVIEKLAWHYDEPFADSSTVPTYYVSKMARENLTVSLSGDGGDENFAGYPRYWFDLRENMVRSFFPGCAGQWLFQALGHLYPKADYLPKVFRGKAFISNVARDPVEAYFFSMSAFYETWKQKLFNPEVNKALSSYSSSELFHRFYDRAPAEDHLSKLQYVDIKTYLCEDILTKVDRASMAVSLEVRCPILDHKFMEYVARIPSKHKLNGKDGKHIFKKALKRYLPDSVLYRRKMGFGVPIQEWLRTDVSGYARELILDGNASQNLFQKPFLNRIWKEHQRGIRNWSTELWTVMMLNLWEKNFG